MNTATRNRWLDLCSRIPGPVPGLRRDRTLKDRPGTTAGFPRPARWWHPNFAEPREVWTRTLGLDKPGLDAGGKIALSDLGLARRFALLGEAGRRAGGLLWLRRAREMRTHLVHDFRIERMEGALSGRIARPAHHSGRSPDRPPTRPGRSIPDRRRRAGRATPCTGRPSSDCYTSTSGRSHRRLRHRDRPDAAAPRPASKGLVVHRPRHCCDPLFKAQAGIDLGRIAGHLRRHQPCRECRDQAQTERDHALNAVRDRHDGFLSRNAEHLQRTRDRSTDQDRVSTISSRRGRPPAGPKPSPRLWTVQPSGDQAPPPAAKDSPAPRRPIAARAGSPAAMRRQRRRRRGRAVVAGLPLMRSAAARPPLRQNPATVELAGFAPVAVSRLRRRRSWTFSATSPATPAPIRPSASGGAEARLEVDRAAASAPTNRDPLRAADRGRACATKHRASASGLPIVASSQSSTATTRGSVGCNNTLPRR